MKEELINYFKALLGEEYVVTSEAARQLYSRDETFEFETVPALVLKPRTAEQVSAILRKCNEVLIPVTPRGAGTGLSGGCVPEKGGIVLSTERMNSILDIDEKNLQVTTEPGVITQVLQDAVKEKGLFYPPDPHSKGSCFIGGNIAENSGGPKAVKYGVVKDYVLNLEVVLPTGEIIWTGANVLKNATGYNLTQLMVGSEGTLGIVTKIVLRLIPHPRYDILIRASFESAEKACAAVSAIFRAGYVPSAIEFMEREAIRCSAVFLTGSDPADTGGTIDEAQLLIEVDGNHQELLMNDIEGISAVLYNFDCSEILLAADAEQKEKLWKPRRCVGEAVRIRSVFREQDTVVPRAALPELINGIREIGDRYGFVSLCCGHAGDGNLHVNVMKDNLSDSDWDGVVKQGIRELFSLVHRLKGTISAEHGIGLLQKEYMDIVFDPVQIRIMKQIKQLFDPNNILNSGKIFP